MAASFPVTFPSALAITSTQTLQEVGHTDNLHIKDRDEIIAAQRKLGLGSSVASGTVALLGTGGTQSAWGQITNAYISGTAAIAVSKLAPGTKGYALLSGDTGAQYGVISRKNLLINGDMRVSQRATFGSFPSAADNTYTTVDRWKTLMSAGFSPNPSTASAPTAGNGSAYALGAISAGTGSKWGYIQILEAADVYALRGRVISLQAKIKATAGLSDIRMALVSWTGTADGATADPVSAWNSAGTNPTLIANWAYINTPANLSVLTTYATYKLESQTVPTDATNLAVFIWSDDTTHTASTDFFFFTDVQLEVGAICTEFELRPYAEELALCQRYYRQFGGTTTSEFGLVGYVASTAVLFSSLVLNPEMRTTPTIGYSAVGDWTIQYGAVATSVCTALSIEAATASPKSVVISASATGTPLTAGQAGRLIASSTSARLKFDAEL